MPRVLGFPELIKYTELEAGQVIFEMGRYEGESEAKYGTLYHFYDVREEKSVSLPACGALRYRIDQGHIKEGDHVQLTFAGKIIMRKGAYAGKEANDLEIAVWDDEDERLAQVAEWQSYKKPKPKPKVAEAVEEDEEDKPLPSATRKQAPVAAATTAKTTSRKSTMEVVPPVEVKRGRGRPPKAKVVEETDALDDLA